ncbi:MAG: hypothetical protein IJT76_07410 [Clostridia bacterium]|nr:hypothetical protein [Clostridia bacterium]
MHPRKIAENDLKAAGYVLKRHGANHDIWFHSETKAMIPLKRHDFNDNDLKYIRKEIRAQERSNV